MDIEGDPSTSINHPTMILKRSSPTVPEGSLPVTTNDNANGAMKSLRKLPPKQKHRKSAGKKTHLVRILGYTMLLFVVFLYVIGTRHVLQMTSSYSARYSIDNASLIPRAAAGIGNDAPQTTRSLSGKPRVLGYYYDLTDSNSYIGTERLDPNMNVLLNSKTRIMREVFMTPEQVAKQERLLDSKSYDYGKADTLQDQGKDCVAQYDWMEKSFPTCNLLMEVDHSNLNYLPIFHENHYNNKHDEPVASGSGHSYSALIASGGWRDVWKVENFLRYNNKQEETFVLKTMKYDREFEERNYDRHRRDHITMERLTSSKLIMNIYGFCGNSGLFEYADGGDLTESIWYNYHPRKGSDEKPWTPEEKMVVAYQAATGLAEMHNFAKEGVAAVVHADIAGDQYVYVEAEGVYKLNDFNRARFLGINSKTHELCNFTVGSNSGTWRSPEEYRYDPETEKIDVYSFGNLLHNLLTGKKLFYDVEERRSRDIMRYVMEGKRTTISTKYTNSTDPFEQTLVKAIERAWVHEPRERATSRELQNMFIQQLEKANVKKSTW